MVRILQAAVMLIFLSFSSVSYADVIFADDFEQEGPYNEYRNNYSSFLFWNVTGAVDLDTPLSGDTRRAIAGMSSYGNFVDLDGSANSAGSLISKSVFTLTPGLYRFGIDIAGPSDSRGDDTNEVRLSIGDVFSRTVSPGRFAPVTRFDFEFNVVTTTQSSISVSLQGPGDNFGPLVDNIRLTAVPEPSSITLAVVGCFGLGLAVRNRKFIQVKKLPT